MEAPEIFDLIRRADERLKYVHGATAGDAAGESARAAARAAARDLLERARDEARAASLDDLARQAELRLDALGGGAP